METRKFLWQYRDFTLWKKKLYYLLSDEVELDFFTQDKILVEAKYETKLNAKQEKLFKEFKANKKFIIDSILKTLELKEI